MCWVVLDFLGSAWNWLKDHWCRNSLSWIFGIIIPLSIFGNYENLKLLFWKITVVCTGAVVFHIIRRQMFPYLDPGLTMKLLRSAETGQEQLFRAVTFIGEAVIIGLLGYAIISSIAGGL